MLMNVDEPLPSGTFQFEAVVTTHDVGGYDYTVVYLPQRMIDSLPLKRYPRLRIVAEVSGVLTEAALQPCRGKWYLMVPKRLQKAASLRIGDLAYVTFEVADQESVNVPMKLLHAIESREVALKVWQSLTAGKKRSLAYRVASAKREETQYRRIEEIVDELEDMAD